VTVNLYKSNEDIVLIRLTSGYVYKVYMKHK
jgi:hypothetical protein